MRCGKAKRLLSGYLDGKIKGSLRSDLESHLKRCEICAQELAAFKQTDKLIRLKAGEHPSPEYWNSYWPRLKDKLEKPAALALNSDLSHNRNPFPSFAPKFRLILNGALVVFLILVIGKFYQDSRQIKSLHALLRKRQVKVESSLSPTPAAFLKTSVAQPPGPSIRNQVKLFREIREMFPQTIRWVITNNGKIELGLAGKGPLEKTAGKEEQPVFLQFRIVRHGRTPAIVSSPKIMVLSGNEINARLDGLSAKDKTVYRYRCLPRLRPNGQVDLLVRISLDGSTLETSLTTGEGEIELGKLRKGDVEYSIYVTVRAKGLSTVKADKNKKI